MDMGLAAPIAELLLADGDPRAALSPETGLTRYGGAPLPQPGTIGLSACSGNEVGPVGLAAAERLQQRLRRRETDAKTVAEEQRNLLVRLLNVEIAAADRVELTASGTAAIRAVAHFYAGADKPCLYLLVGPRESGREIPATVAVGPQVTVAGVELRDDHSGAAKSMESLVAELRARIVQALDAGQRVVLQVVEGSKTGLVGPGIDGVRALREQFPDLGIVVDCCQMRPGTLISAYWQLGAAIVATGSKFLGGPIFSGIALIPGGGQAAMPSVGTLVRWQAALAECADYGQLTAKECTAGLFMFADIVRKECARFPGLVPLADRYPTHVATVLVNDGAGRAVEIEGLRHLTQWLEADASSLLPQSITKSQRHLAQQRCLVGQPVAVGQRAGLRLAINARRLVSMVKDRDGLSKLTQDVATILGKLAILIDNGGQQPI